MPSATMQRAKSPPLARVRIITNIAVSSFKSKRVAHEMSPPGGSQWNSPSSGTSQDARQRAPRATKEAGSAMPAIEATNRERTNLIAWLSRLNIFVPSRDLVTA